MVTITSSKFSFLVEFVDSDFYLRDGSMSFPKNSLSLVIDESNIITFKKVSNGDVIFSCLLSDGLVIDGTTATKSNLPELFETATTMPVGSDPAITVTSVELSSGDTEMLFLNESGDTVYSVDMSPYLVDLHVTGASLSGDELSLYMQDGSVIVVNIGGILDDVYTKQETDTLLAEKLDTSAFTSAEQAIANAISELNGDIASVSGAVENLDLSDYQPVSGMSAYTLQSNFESAEQAIANAISDIYDDIVELSAHTATTLVAGDNITISGDVISSNQVIELTQAEYDALSGDVDPSKLYVITDAPSADLSNYTLTSTTAALSGKVNTISGDVATVSGQVATKQDQLTAGSGITIVNNVISSNADMSNVYTKSEIDNAEQATSAALNDLNLRIIELSGNTFDDSVLADYQPVSGMSGYATTIYVDAQIGNINTALNNILNSN